MTIPFVGERVLEREDVEDGYFPTLELAWVTKVDDAGECGEAVLCQGWTHKRVPSVAEVAAMEWGPTDIWVRVPTVTVRTKREVVLG